MLQATKAQLITQFSEKSVELRQLELKYWLKVFEKFAVLSALLGGFAAAVLLKVPNAKVPVGASLLYVLMSGSAVGCNMVLLAISVLCAIWAPGKGLLGRGHESYEAVLQLMEAMYWHSLFFFKCGLFFYFVTLLLSSFCFFDVFGGVVISCILACFAYFVIKHLKALLHEFVPSKFTTAVLQGNCISDIGNKMTSDSDPALSGMSFNLGFANSI
ncbi:hypothetical protein IE077_003594 [Cardiosporidium cionae]|uniref:Uncharacterized protein n=1 Tax=Cardiosporidium cionae TaxID=476202 RepID=A0ABQ7JGG2_9APIC|nr:hypothetical protein IE077_003594 [Cardiosporidium cionae]|eukprot:KAF8823101.1 hypothetical protein IE077_003594 [Cardiosporidium cionae]